MQVFFPEQIGWAASEGQGVFTAIGECFRWLTALWK